MYAGMRTQRAFSLGLLSLTALAAWSGRAATGNNQAPPEPRRDVIAANGVVAAAHPLAARAGLGILQAGGNAVDAAIATALALGVVEPNASGPGGGGFALVYIAREKKSYVVDFRETAPAKVRPDTYQARQKGKGVSNPSVTGYQAVAVPGELRGLEMLHKMFSTKPWAALVQPAIQQAEAGVVVSETLSQIVADEFDRLEKAPAMPWLQKNFYKDGLPVQPGDVVRNPELVQTLKKIAAGGAEVFYKGEIAGALVKEFADKGEDWITADDLANYKAVLREPLQGAYRGYAVVTLPPPSSGGLTLLELLNLLEGYDLARLGRGSVDYLHVTIEAQKLAFADRAEYMADPAFAKVPVAGLLDKRYAGERRATIDLQRTKKASPGAPNKYESGSTTSLSVADKDGNLATITQTINHFMGAGVVPEGTGILLNDEMDDFEFKAGSLNTPAPGKRPLSSIAPVILLKDGKPLLTAGSPGATRIITAMANIVVNVVDFKQELREAILAPRFHNGNTTETSVEARFAPDVLKSLEARGHHFSVKRDLDLYFGGAQGVMCRSDGKLLGMGDPRRDGVAVGY
jgi:gamma-glutamyltranspeptidase/glutathione hydrolase